MFEGHGNPVTVATITSDGKILASASVNGTIQLWETVTGQCLYTLEGQDSTITAATFTPNCEILASASVNGIVQVWDTATGRCLHVLTGHDSPVTAATFISDGKILASASVNGTIRLWDITTGQCLYTLEGQDNPITVATFTPDCEVLASASVNGTVQVWDTSTGRCLHVLTGHDRTVIAAAFTPDGKILASVSVNGTIQLWETATGQCLYTLEGHQNSVIAASFTPNGKKLALASVNGTVQLRETVTGKLEYMQRLTLLNYHKIELRVKWDVPEAMRLYKKGTRFSSILTITGNKVDAQAATCESYLNEHFKTGPTLLHIIQEAWDSKASSNTKSSEGDLQYLSIKIDGLEHENAVAIVSGTVEMIREVIHAFAWFCCAMRPAPSHNFSLSTFSFDLHATMEERCPKVTLEFNLLRQDAGSEDCCWQGLFRKANIISDAPISDRTQFGQLRGEQSGKLHAFSKSAVNLSFSFSPDYPQNLLRTDSNYSQKRANHHI
jgi:WD40 repeat protein